MSIELNEEFRRSLELMENTCRNILIIGKAGTGKSTLLDYFRKHTTKKVVVIAPTGVAAVNVQGETIHSFFGFRPDITPERVRKKSRNKIYQELDTIIIDEISMVRADLLDCVDKFLRLNRDSPHTPFGGVQMIFIGDLYQLPPVIQEREKTVFKTLYSSGYFFSARVFRELDLELVELEKIYRQKDPLFIKILNSIRNNTVTEEELEILNRRVRKNIEIEDLPYYIFLTSTNRVAERINRTRLERINSPSYTFEGKIWGEFEEKYLPTDYLLHLKEGAQVMLLNNDEYGRWVNGTIARVREIHDSGEEGSILVELPGGEIEEVTPFKWELYHFQWNEEKNRLESKVIGEFVQYPLRLAWAITIHKSQGKTFERAVIDISGGVFAPGQVYVALSRCESLEGIILTQPIKKKHIFMDRRVVKFLTHLQYQQAEKILPLDKRIGIIQQAIERRTPLRITYLKPNDEKSSRIIRPLEIGEMKYRGKTFLGVSAYCTRKKDKRVFRIDRILELEPLS